MMNAPDEPPYYDPPSMPFSTQRSELRARIGKQVGDKLDETPGVWRLSSSRERPVQFYAKDDFLTVEECRTLSGKIDEGCFPSPLFEKDKYEGVRTSDSCNLNVHDPFIAAIETRIAELLGIDRSWGEPLQGQRYAIGQCFKEHADFFYIDQPYWQEYGSHGGQRTWTAMIYLVAPDRGGGTRFRFLDTIFEPKVGRIIIWNNMALDGSPNSWTLHEGQPVDEGTKYIVTKWYRERPFA